MLQLEEKYEFYFYQKEERLATCYLFLLLILLLFVYIIMMIPYQKQEHVIGVTKKIENEIVVVIHMNPVTISQVNQQKVWIEKKEYRYQIRNTRFLESGEVELFLHLQPNLYQTENQFISLRFSCGKTTIMKEYLKKMKGWFL